MSATWGEPPDPSPNPVLVSLAEAIREALVEKRIEYLAAGYGGALGDTVSALVAARVVLQRLGGGT